MPIKVPTQTIVVYRDGKSKMLPLNKPFNFTDAEIKDIMNTNPKAIRDLIVEAEPVAPKKEDDTDTSLQTGETKSFVAPQGGKKSYVAQTSDKGDGEL